MNAGVLGRDSRERPALFRFENGGATNERPASALGAARGKGGGRSPQSAAPTWPQPRAKTGICRPSQEAWTQLAGVFPELAGTDTASLRKSAKYGHPHTKAKAKAKPTEPSTPRVDLNKLAADVRRAEAEAIAARRRYESAFKSAIRSSL